MSNRSSTGRPCRRSRTARGCECRVANRRLPGFGLGLGRRRRVNCTCTGQSAVSATGPSCHRPARPHRCAGADVSCGHAPRLRPLMTRPVPKTIAGLSDPESASSMRLFGSWSRVQGQGCWTHSFDLDPGSVGQFDLDPGSLGQWRSQSGSRNFARRPHQNGARRMARGAAAFIA